MSAPIMEERMTNDIRVLIVNNIKLSVNASYKEAFSLAKKKIASVSVYPKDAEYSIYRRSVDARRKSDIKFIYSVAVRGIFPKGCEQRLLSVGASFDKSEYPSAECGSELMSDRPVVVGSGPCGLFCALMLAERGYAPILLERGSGVSERKAAVERFRKFGVLDPNTNIQFGAGGAGTFSDGKLVTRVNDGMGNYVLSRFVEFGAPTDITYVAKPHIGTDVLLSVVDNIVDRIRELGGEVRFKTRFTGYEARNGRVVSVSTDGGDIPAGALVLAIGHSSRDTYEYLLSRDVMIEAKNFSVGMRIEHLADDIDEALYGSFAGHPNLGRAEYALSHNTKERGVYTFCMCPGGEVVAAASEEGGVVVNGMSERNRDGRNSNSAVVCSIFKEDYGASAKEAISFCRKIERAAYRAGGSDYYAPMITVGDFLSDKASSEPGRVIPTYMDGKVRIARPEKYLPEFVCASIKNALLDFDRKIKGFANSEAVLTGAETRTSAPVRILRDSENRRAPGYDNLYPAGEGAGYAGGITSAAIDGIRTALAIIGRYKPLS